MKTISFVVLIVGFLNVSFAQGNIIVVAKDGSGNYTTIQSALNAIHSNTPSTIHIKTGVYNEIVVVDATKNKIIFLGDGKEKTIISFNNHAGMKMENGDTVNTWTSATTFIYGNDFTAQNIGFRNDAGFTAGQAVAVRVEGNRAAFYNCAITGFQDVLFLSGSGVKQYFQNCYIEGTTDFIFGASTAVFNNCLIKSKKNSHVTAASTNSIIPFGFVFLNCKLISDSGLNNVSLGRPWSPTASVTYINCWMDKHITPSGWNNWKNPVNESTARFAEYHNSGPGANTEARVKWSKQLTDSEAKSYTIANILGHWDPVKKANQ